MQSDPASVLFFLKQILGRFQNAFQIPCLEHFCAFTTGSQSAEKQDSQATLGDPISTRWTTDGCATNPTPPTFRNGTFITNDDCAITQLPQVDVDGDGCGVVGAEHEHDPTNLSEILQCITRMAALICYEGVTVEER
ncbi:unnamed protein product [Strongylus vulgaris]|uniref:Uncharacterized protein n=1 Tax=Strongylus vulgaris TaxID=40348 RepID=A0A3P7LAD8_STRVU|nr:unnamed protein product [Strongylus vulgaris]